MSRPTRMTRAKIRNYADMVSGSDEEEEFVNQSDGEEEEEDDSDFDDPDKVEIPGGGTSLEDAKKISKSEEEGEEVKVKVKEEGGPGLMGKFKLPEGTTVTASSVPQRMGTTSNANSFSNFASLPLMGNPLDPLAAFLSNPLSMELGSLEQIHQLISMYAPTTKQEGSAMLGGSSSTTPFLQQFYGMLAQNAMASMYNRGGSHMGAFNRSQPRMMHQNPQMLGVGSPMQQQLQGGQQHAVPNPKIEPEEEIGEEDELALAETYAEYVPAKLKIGKPHPDSIVETSSLSSVQPPEVYYRLSLPSDVIDGGLLSALQLEAVVYTCQQHEHILPNGQRAGFLVGDGAGVGKGRTIAGIIFENWLIGRKKSLWVSISADLKEDAIRDLRDIGANKINVFALNKQKYGRIKSDEHKSGVLFSTYSGLIGESSSGGKYNSRFKQIVDWLGKDFDGVLVFDECHRAKNLCPTGNAKPTKTGVTVDLLQKELPLARVVYASATGASEPRNMAYMSRLGIWGIGTPFPQFMDFINAVERRGVGAMEMVAMDLKLRGAYIARQLSFKGVSFNIEDVALTPEFRDMYDSCVELWVEALQKFIEAAELMQADNMYRKTMWGQFWSSHQRFFKYLCIAAKVPRAVEIAFEALKSSKCVVIGLQSTGEARTAEQVEREGELEEFVSTAKGVFQSLIEKHLPAPNRIKVQKLLALSLNKNGGLHEDAPQPGTSSSSSKGKPMRRAAIKAADTRAKFVKWNESDGSDDDERDSDFSGAASESEDDDVSTDSKASGSDDYETVSEEDVESDEEKGGRGKRGRKRKLAIKKKPKVESQKRDPTKEALDQACQIRKYLLDKVEKLGSKMPSNTLDQLIDDLGGPDDVAEMTGRKMRLIQLDSGKIEYQSRAENDVTLEQINITEKKRFMDMEKRTAIISEAASSGISLQSDRRVANQLRRVHITLELPWSADRAIQQFGRTHRSNQVSAPEYVFLISDLAGEHRFASIVAKRLESLGALTHGDRRASESRDLSRFHIDNKYGKMALEAVMKYIMTGNMSGFAVAPDYPGGDFRADVAHGMLGVGLIVNSEDNLGTPIPDKDYHNISKFLNRILGMKVDLQNALFKFFTDMLTAIINQAKKDGRFDMGILNLGDSTGDKTSLLSTKRFARKHATGVGSIELHEVSVERGMTFEEAMKKYNDLHGKCDGFYITKNEKSHKQPAVLVCSDKSLSTTTVNKKGEKLEVYAVYRPSTGLQARRESLKDIESKYKKITPDKAKPVWEDQYKDACDNCIHAYWNGNCKKKAAGIDCDVGKRKRTYFVLSGSLLLCWDEVERVIRSSMNSHKMQIVRVQLPDGQKFVGVVIPSERVEVLAATLDQQASNGQAQPDASQN